MSSDLSAPQSTVKEIVSRALAEDLTPLGDITSTLLPPEVQATARFLSRGEGVIAGSSCAIETFAQVDDSLIVDWKIPDGSEVASQDVLAEIVGSLASIMSAERTARNFLAHLSGIATLTRRYVRAGQNKARIRDSRFTTPGLRALEKAAVRAGGGVNHRGSLSDGILLRDKHLSHVSYADAVRRARLRWPGRFVEVECRDANQVAEVLEGKPDMIMLDGISAEAAKEIVAMVGKSCPIEVYGNIDIRDIGAYVDAGVEFISVTNLTQSAPAFEIGFEVKAK